MRGHNGSMISASNNRYIVREMADLSKAQELAGAIFEKKETEQKKKAQGRRCSYLILIFCLQFLCCVVLTLAVLWATTQLLRLTNFLGVSEEPPGLTYYVTYPDPPPPPSVL